MIIVELVKLVNKYKKIKKFVDDNKYLVSGTCEDTVENLRKVVKQVEESYSSLKKLLNIAIELLKKVKEEV